MELRVVGRTGMHVSTICLGTAMFGPWGNDDPDESVRIVHRALDAGINFVDTSDVYSTGGSEEIVGRALRGGRRDDVILATKFGLPIHGAGHDEQAVLRREDPNRCGASRRYIMKAVDASLKRLETDWIDLYYVHRPDPSCDIDETLGALSDLVHAGKIRAFGCSAFAAHELVDARWTARTRGREYFACEQPSYSMLVRGVEADVLPVCERLGMGVVVCSPLDAGWLSGKYRSSLPVPALSKRGELNPARFAMDSPESLRKLEAAEQLATLAAEAGMSLPEMAMAFILRHPAVTSVIAGPRLMEHLDDALSGSAVVLSDDLLDRIDSIVPAGTNFHVRDAGMASAPALENPALRRRPVTPVPSGA